MAIQNRMRTDPFFVSNKDSFARGMADVRLPQVRLRQSLLKLDISDASCTCFDWVTATRLAVGLSDGEMRDSTVSLA
jgi:hypothetical protein